MTSAAKDEYPVEEVARAWLTKMRGEGADTLRAEFEEWRAASPRHRDAYDRISSRMAQSAILKNSARYGVARVRGPRQERKTGRVPWSTIAVAATALLLVAYGAGGASLPGLPSTASSTASATERLVTQLGEIRKYRLRDGSLVTLDTDSQVDISFRDGKPELRLARGRVRLAATDTGAAILLRAGDGVIVATNADLDVSLDADGRVRMALRRGAASMSEANGRRNASSLPLGRTLTFRDGASMRFVARSADNLARDWPSGWAEYRSISLGDLVAEANRYAARPIVIDQPSVAQLQLTGRFKISDADALARRTATLFGLVATERHDGLHLRQK